LRSNGKLERWATLAGGLLLSMCILVLAQVCYK
jgi:hypothetical protein